jgi:signal peptidase I
MQYQIKPRKPLFALAMSFFLPGFGHMYNGDLNRAIWLFLSFALLSIPGVALIALYLPRSWMMVTLTVGLILTLSIWLYAMTDAWRGATRKQEYFPKIWQTSGAYALTFLLCDALALPLLTVYVMEHQVASFYIPSASMEPGVLRGDIIFADKRYNCPGCKSEVRRGDIAIFTYPNNRTISYIKRVIALPGDRVRVDGHSIWINDKLLTVSETGSASNNIVTESYANHQWQVQWTSTDNESHKIEMTVPAGEVFVLGDNRSETKDSRNFGPVPLHDVVGRAQQVWFSKAPHGGIRWERLGKLLN